MVPDSKGVLLTLEALAVLSLAPAFLLLAETVSDDYTLRLVRMREDSVLAQDILQAWAEGGMLEEFRNSGDDAALKADLDRLSSGTGKTISLWRCSGNCICEARKSGEVVVCVGGGQ